MLGPEEHLRTFTRDAIVAFRRAPVGGRARRRVPGRQPRARARGQRAGRAVRPLPVDLGRTAASSRRRRSRRRRWSRSASPTSRTCGCPTGPPIDPRDPPQRAALAVYSTLLGGSMGSRLFDEIREQRGLAYSRLLGRPHVRRRADPAALGRPGVRQVRRGLHAHARDRRRAAHRRADRGGGRARARLRRRPARAGVREHERRRAPRGAADRRLRRRTSTPTRRSRRSTRSRSSGCAEVARGISEASVACVGPHEAPSSNPRRCRAIRGSPGCVSPTFSPSRAGGGRRASARPGQPGRGAEAPHHPTRSRRQGPAAGDQRLPRPLQTSTPGGIRPPPTGRAARRRPSAAGGAEYLASTCAAPQAPPQHADRRRRRPDRRAARCCRRCSTTSRRSRR